MDASSSEDSRLEGLNKNMPPEAASCCLPSPFHQYKSNTENGLNYCSIFPCFVYLFIFYFPSFVLFLALLPRFPEQLQHTPVISLISPSGVQILVIFWVSLDGVRTD